MMTTQVIAWMTAVQSLMAVAPDVIEFAGKAKQWIRDMFTTGMISAEVQDELSARVTAICVAALNKETPAHWQIEADPTPDQPQAPV